MTVSSFNSMVLEWKDIVSGEFGGGGQVDDGKICLLKTSWTEGLWPGGGEEENNRGAVRMRSQD
jgi:hypothetical protein